MDESYTPLSKSKLKNPQQNAPKKDEEKEGVFSIFVGGLCIILIPIVLIITTLTGIEGFFRLWIDHGFIHGLALLIRVFVVFYIPCFMFMLLYVKTDMSIFSCFVSFMIFCLCLGIAELIDIGIANQAGSLVKWWWGY